MMSMMRDTLDGRLDFSRFLIDMHGFIPVPMIITEPALGGFGGVLAPVFMKQKKVEGYDGYIPPDITAAVALLTVNGSYGFGAFRMGSFPKKGIKYRIGILSSSLNINFYRTLPNLGEKSFLFNFKTTPVFLSVSKKIDRRNLYLGLTYAYAYTKVSAEFSEALPPDISLGELDSRVSTFGLFTEVDKRDNIFTPDKGYFIHLEGKFNGSWTGSDYDYQRIDLPFNVFFPIRRNWISGFRVEVNHVFNDPPFYLLPSLRMRGIPAARYQGRTTVAFETEQRYDLDGRWSVLGFLGYGITSFSDESIAEGSEVVTFGTGFRYLIARAFKVRAGIDVAWGPDSFGWYIVFGHNWNR